MTIQIVIILSVVSLAIFWYYRKRTRILTGAIDVIKIQRNNDVEADREILAQVVEPPESIPLLGNYTHSFGLHYFALDPQFALMMPDFSKESVRADIDENTTYLLGILREKYWRMRRSHDNPIPHIIWILSPFPELKTIDGITWRTVRMVSGLQLILERDSNKIQYKVYYSEQAKVIFKSFKSYYPIDKVESFENLNSGLGIHIATLFLSLPEINNSVCINIDAS